MPNDMQLESASNFYDPTAPYSLNSNPLWLNHYLPDSSAPCPAIDSSNSVLVLGADNSVSSQNLVSQQKQVRASVASKDHYTVARGDTLTSIAEKVYGVSRNDSNFQSYKDALQAANSVIKEQNKIFVGDEFALPDVDADGVSNPPIWHSGEHGALVSSVVYAEKPVYEMGLLISDKTLNQESVVDTQKIDGSARYDFWQKHLHRNDNMSCPETLPTPETNSEWHVESTSYNPISRAFHGPGRYDVRGLAPALHGVQCIYESNGHLVTGSGAGTYDFSPPYTADGWPSPVGLVGHVIWDVLPEAYENSIQPDQLVIGDRISARE